MEDRTSDPSPGARSVRALDENRLREAIKEALRWTRSYCSSRSWLDTEDVEAAALVGAFNAWDRYDPQARPRKQWDHFLFAHIDWEVRKSLRPQQTQLRRLGPVYSLDAPPDPNSDETLASAVPSREDVFATLALKELVERLPPLEQWVLGQRYFGKMEPKDVAVQLGQGYTPTWVRQTEQRALATLRAIWVESPAAA